MKDGIISFRLPGPHDKKLVAATKEAAAKVVGIKSENQFVRKLVVDFLAGRLVYIDPAARDDNPLLNQ